MLSDWGSQVYNSQYFDHSPLIDQGPEPDYTPDEDGGVVHYGPGDRPLCGNDCRTTVYTDDPAGVTGCAECLDMVEEDLADHNEYLGCCLHCRREITAQGAGCSGTGRSGGPARTVDELAGDEPAPTTSGLHSDVRHSPQASSVTLVRRRLLSAHLNQPTSHSAIANFERVKFRNRILACRQMRNIAGEHVYVVSLL